MYIQHEVQDAIRSINNSNHVIFRNSKHETKLKTIRHSLLIAGVAYREKLLAFFLEKVASKVVGLNLEHHCLVSAESATTDPT